MLLLYIISAMAIVLYYMSLVVHVRDESHEEATMAAGKGLTDLVHKLYVMQLAHHLLKVTMQFRLLPQFICVSLGFLGKASNSSQDISLKVSTWWWC